MVFGGGGNDKKIQDFDKEWINPFWVFDKIKNNLISLKMGAIHGDLHPRNIVISHDDIPKIIDFGWTQPEAHFAKDFALMEANIRFVSLKPDYSYSYLTKLSKSIESDSISKELDDPVFS
ncbi:hypothetical protein Paes_0639 [Prosthecochloris aestuarii DSM 271]|uniref:Ternary complex associated domain-containing protein n=1 Tax=Prosthecochloris aestuarii (strain DSM 271 / SK 413) TaxID=290512 RepID=B4S640_PROA2|nr:hypothetical protein Paes_0639 [Prosthecochloris aestuarii DSM 271]